MRSSVFFGKKKKSVHISVSILICKVGRLLQGYVINLNPHWMFLDCNPHGMYLYNPTIGDVNDNTSFPLNIVLSLSLSFSLSLVTSRSTPLGRGWSQAHQQSSSLILDIIWHNEMSIYSRNENF